MNHDVMLIGPACRDENIDYGLPARMFSPP